MNDEQRERLRPFFERLTDVTKRKGYEWRLLGTCIRCVIDDVYCCPLTSLLPKPEWSHRFPKAKEVLRMCDDDIFSVADAADGTDGEQEYDQELRDELLRICGLK